MMNPEAIFTIIFITVLLLIPFGLGLHLSRSLRKRKDIETLFSETHRRSGRIIGYTKRKYDTENIGDYYPIIEYISDAGERLWAEGDSCDKDDYSINSTIKILFHPRDERHVMPVLTEEQARMRMKFEKNIELFANLIFTVFILGTFIHYKGASPHLLILLFLTYAVGFVFGAVLSTKKSDEKLRIRHSKVRNQRLVAAQAKGFIPCYLEE